jgi:hypothetical protein
MSARESRRDSTDETHRNRGTSHDQLTFVCAPLLSSYMCARSSVVCVHIFPPGFCHVTASAHPSDPPDPPDPPACPFHPSLPRSACRCAVVRSSGGSYALPRQTPLGCDMMVYLLSGEKVWILAPPAKSKQIHKTFEPPLTEIRVSKWKATEREYMTQHGFRMIHQFARDTVFIPAGWWYCVKDLSYGVVALHYAFLRPWSLPLTFEYLRALDASRACRHAVGDTTALRRHHQRREAEMTRSNLQRVLQHTIRHFSDFGLTKDEVARLKAEERAYLFNTQDGLDGSPRAIADEDDESNSAVSAAQPAAPAAAASAWAPTVDVASPSRVSTARSTSSTNAAMNEATTDNNLKLIYAVVDQHRMTQLASGSDRERTGGELTLQAVAHIVDVLQYQRQKQLHTPDTHQSCSVDEWTSGAGDAQYATMVGRSPAKLRSDVPSSNIIIVVIVVFVFVCLVPPCVRVSSSSVCVVLESGVGRSTFHLCQAMKPIITIGILVDEATVNSAIKVTTNETRDRARQDSGGREVHGCRARRTRRTQSQRR